MTADDVPPETVRLAEEWRSDRDAESTRDRVYGVAVQLYDPTRVKAVAERADVSKETARDYLKWFTEMGILDQVSGSPDTFERNEQYFEWRRIQRLRSKSDEELTGELEDLTAQERAYRERFDAEDPGAVDALAHADYDDVESVWMALQKWRTVRRRIRELEQARQHRDDGTHAHA